MMTDAEKITVESRIKLKSGPGVRVAAITGPRSLDLLGFADRPAEVTNCYRIHHQAAANFEVVEATDEQMAALRAGGYAAIRDGRRKPANDPQ